MDNGNHGIEIEGQETKYNRITENSITDNDQKGIHLSLGNESISAPTIDYYTYTLDTIRGYTGAPDGSVVEVFSDDDDEGMVFLGKSKVLYGRFEVNGYGAQGLNLHATVTHPNGNTSEFGPAYTLGEQLNPFAYVTTSSGNKDISLFDPNSNRSYRLTYDQADDYSPQFSPDGNAILYVSEANGNPDLWFMKTDGADAAVAISDPSPDYDPNWRQDIDDILFVSERTGNAELYRTKPPMGSSAEIIYDNGVSGGGESLPEGDAFAVHFNSNGGQVNRISFYIANKPAEFTWKLLGWENDQPSTHVFAEGNTTPNASGWHVVSIEPVDVPEEFAVALYYLSSHRPGIGFEFGDSSRSFYSMGPFWYNYWQRIMIRATMVIPEPIQITNNPATDRYPVWSPDGSKIAFSSDRDGTMDIWLMNADGSNETKLTDGLGNNIKPEWPVDNNIIYFVSDRDGDNDIYRINIDGTNLMPITQNDVNDTDPVFDQDRESLLFSSDRTGDGEIFDRSSSGKIKQLTTTLLNSTEPDVAPIGVAVPTESQTMQTLSAAKEKNPIPAGNRFMSSKIIDAEEYIAIAELSTATDSDVEIPIFVSSHEPIGNLEFELAYQSIDLGLNQLPSALLAQQGMYAINPIDYPSNSSRLRFNWIKAEGFHEAGDFLTLNFHVDSFADDAEYPITFKVLNVYGLDESKLNIENLNGKIMIEGNGTNTNVNSWMLYDQ